MPPSFQGTNIGLIKAHNLRAILQTLLFESQLSRVQLAERTSLSTTTITNLIAELVDQGLVVETDGEMAKTQNHIGRPRTGLRLAGEARAAVGLSIQANGLDAGIVNLAGQIQQVQSTALSPASPEEAIGAATDLIGSLLSERDSANDDVLGIGVAVSGLVDFESGDYTYSPDFGWRNVPLGKALSRELDMPVCIDSRARAIALGESLFGAGRMVHALACLDSSSTVETGFVVGRRIARGSPLGTGAIGHMVILPEGGDVCRCGNTGCLETLVSEPALFRAAQEFAHDDPENKPGKVTIGSEITERSPSSNESAGLFEREILDRLFTAAREGDREAVRLIKARSHYIGIALANLVNLFNPELIVLGGVFRRGFDLFAPYAGEVMRQRSFDRLGDGVRLVPASFGEGTRVTGAASLALSAFFYQ
jgi:glucokinase/transcriptional regulator of PTS gene